MLPEQSATTEAETALLYAAAMDAAPGFAVDG